MKKRLLDFLAAAALLASFAATFAAVNSDRAWAAGMGASAAMTEEVLGKHLAAFGAGNVDGIIANYAADAAIIVPGAVMHGHKDIRPMFEGLVAEFGQPGVTFTMLHKTVEGDVAQIVWQAETGKNVYELATDTFVVRDGKIVSQTFAGKITAK